jgi:hypothetical protein
MDVLSCLSLSVLLYQLGGVHDRRASVHPASHLTTLDGATESARFARRR